MQITQTQVHRLIALAQKTRHFAFAHRSGHPIGASVLTVDGRIYGGCNIESVISGMGTCAERTAMDHAIAHGAYEFRAICTVDNGLTPSCGACLQYALLFSQLENDDIVVVTADTHGHYQVTPLSVLLPDGYKTKHNLSVIRSFRKKAKRKSKTVTRRKK